MSMIMVRGYLWKIFRAFERVETKKVEGLGLGLSICRKIVEFHGGKISIDESPLGGCRFSFNLPK
jgi:signal transduction histidine kinase